jgi:hypothetical protein
MLQVLRHSDLPHNVVLVSVHARESANMRKNVLKVGRPRVGRRQDSTGHVHQRQALSGKKIVNTGQIRRIGTTDFTGFKYIL